MSTVPRQLPVSYQTAGRSGRDGNGTNVDTFYSSPNAQTAPIPRQYQEPWQAYFSSSTSK